MTAAVIQSREKRKKNNKQNLHQQKGKRQHQDDERVHHLTALLDFLLKTRPRGTKEQTKLNTATTAVTLPTESGSIYF